jgi:hypothetical protein
VESLGSESVWRQEVLFFDVKLYYDTTILWSYKLLGVTTRARVDEVELESGSRGESCDRGITTVRPKKSVNADETGPKHYGIVDGMIDAVTPDVVEGDGK